MSLSTIRLEIDSDIGTIRFLKPEENLDEQSQKILGAFLALMHDPIGITNAIDNLDDIGLNDASKLLDDFMQKWTEQGKDEIKELDSYLNQDIISPHGVFSDKSVRNTYSSPPIKPETIITKYTKKDLTSDEDEYAPYADSSFHVFDHIFTLDTNFRITKKLINKLIPIDGIEVLHPISRNKLIIRFADAYNEEYDPDDIYGKKGEIKYKIYKAIQSHFDE